MLRDVVALVDERIHPFELGVACEIFGIDRSEEGLPRFDFAVCSQDAQPLPATGGMLVQVSHGLERAESADLIVIPAWHTREEPPSRAIVTVLREAIDRGARVVSECTGVFLLAAAGLLTGRRVTAHWRDADRLARRYPDLNVECDRLYIADGQIITSAGTSAGIDACLYVVRDELGVAAANGIARRMVVPPHRHGGQAQYVETPVPRSEGGTDDLSPVLAWIQGNLHRNISVASLAERAHMSARTFARRFGEATGTTPNQWLVRQRVLLAQSLLEQGDLDIEQISHRCGFGSADVLRHHFVRQLGTSPSAYRRAFAAT